MNIIVEHHHFTEIPGHPIAFWYQPDDIIGVRDYLALGIVATIDFGLALGDANNRVYDEPLGKHLVMPAVRWDNYLQAHFISPSNAARTSLMSITLLRPTLPVLYDLMCCMHNRSRSQLLSTSLPDWIMNNSCFSSYLGTNG